MRSMGHCVRFPREDLLWEILVKKFWSLFVCAPVLALTIATVGCDPGPAQIDPADSDTSTGDIELTEEEEEGEAAIGEGG